MTPSVGARIGLQLYTVREEMEKNLQKTFDVLADLGVQGVELWFPRSYPRQNDLKRMLDSAGLVVAGAHVPFTVLLDGFNFVADYHAAIGNRDLVVPIIKPAMTLTEADWEKRIDELVEVAQQAKNEGFKLHFHNHMGEFEQTIGGREVHDVLFERIPAPLLLAELDTCFLKQSGKDPAAYIRKYKNRLTHLHVKEANHSRNPVDTILGEGTVDWKSVFATASECPIEWFILEQGFHPVDAWDSVEKNLKFIRTMVGATA